MPSISGFHHVSLTVTDRATSEAWYCDVLGFERHSEVRREGFERARLRHPDAGITISLTQHEGGSAERFNERRTGLDHFALLVDADALDSWKRRFEERGVDHSEIKETVQGGRMITLRDPDNIQLEVFALPRASG